MACNGPGFYSWQRQEAFLSPLSFVRSSKSPVLGVTGAYFPRVRPGYGADHSRSSSAEFKNELSCTSTLHVGICLHSMNTLYRMVINYFWRERDKITGSWSK
jgi:hypothetical protein